MFDLRRGQGKHRTFILLYSNLGYSCISVIKWHLLEVVYLGTRYALNSNFVVDKNILFPRLQLGCIPFLHWQERKYKQLKYNNRLKFPYQKYMNIQFISYIYIFFSEKLKS